MNQKLGFAIDDRLLLINADDFGITKGTNEAVISLFEQGAYNINIHYDAMSSCKRGCSAV
jgi:hypothetical protein